MELSLLGKNALVCGSSRGIGLAAAEEISKLGANVTLTARDAATLAAVVGQLDQTLGQRHDFLQADFTDSADLKKKIRGLTAGKNIHILVNNTGGPPPGAITTADEEAFERAFRQHVIANQLLSQAVLPGMRQDGYGRIINVISTSVKTPLPNLGVSNTIRAAVANWAKTLANELGPEGITVNNVLPGATLTDRLRDMVRQQAANSDRSELEVMEGMLSNIPLRRFADAHDVAAAIAFLASPAAAYITGINLPVDGGRTPAL